MSEASEVQEKEPQIRDSASIRKNSKEEDRSSLSESCVRPTDSSKHANVSSSSFRKTEKEREWVATPLPMDIICGRGAKMTHPGNRRFRDIVLAHQSDYQKAKRREDKTRITADIVNLLLVGAKPARYVRFPLSCSLTDKLSHCSVIS